MGSAVRMVRARCACVGRARVLLTHRAADDDLFFSSEEFERAMETSLELLESGEADACDFHDVNGDDALESNEENEDGFEEDFGFDANAYIPPGQAPPGFE